MFASVIGKVPSRLGIVAFAVATGFAGAASAQPATTFTADFAAMAGYQALAAQGTGKIAVLLPETTTSARYIAFDEPYIRRALEAAGLTANDYIITNAGGDEAVELTQAQAAIAQGATVLIMDPISSGVGAAIHAYAAERGVTVIDYDRLTLGANSPYYVSFDNVAVGRLIGEGMVQCIADWGVANPNVLVMRGAPTDNNATLFGQGYMEVLQPHFAAGAYVNAGEPAGTWDPAVARTTFEQQLTGNNAINAVVTPNDDNANAIIAYLKSLQVPARAFPTTGQDATVTGVQNILAGYQCGTVYKAIYLEAQAAVALALYVRAGQEPPAALVNGVTNDGQRDVPSVLLTPLWVTAATVGATVITDNFVPAAQSCAGNMAAACTAAGITP
jgi:D-xylose transport system substrate-binding protein